MGNDRRALEKRRRINVSVVGSESHCVSSCAALACAASCFSKPWLATPMSGWPISSITDR
eukprot:jgi/Chrpa1/8250/Chrysochromulina_OHIO_Genome00016348-RA